MSRNALQLIVATAMLCMSTLSVFAQLPATSAQKFSLRNPVGESVTLTLPPSGVTSHTLTFPSTLGLAGQVLTLSSTTGGLAWTTAAGGTVASFSAGNLTPLFTTGVTNATTTPHLSFTLSNQNANTVFAGPSTGLPGAPSFRQLVGSDITGAALTDVDDANVTLTLGGSPSTALLNATSLTLGWTGLLAINRGGTNSNAAPTDGGIAFGDGTAYQFTAAGTSGQVLRSNGTADPTWANANSLVTGSALTDVDDANVTLTLGGTPGTSLLQAVTITAGWNGVLSTARGGTGLSTIGTANQVLAVNGAGTALTYVTPTNGTVTNFSAGDLTPLFTTSEATTTTTPALSFNLTNQNAGTVFAGPVSGLPGAPTFRALTGSDITGAALTETDDANVQLTLTGTPGSALLQGVNIAAGWSGVLSTARGGTGLSTIGTAGQVLRVNAGATGLEYATPTNGTVTSVGLTMPSSIFDVTNSPITSSGNLAVTFDNQVGNTVFASPANGSSGTPTFRSLVAADIPALNYVSSVALGNLNHLFTTSNVGTATAPSFTFTPVSQAANLVFASPSGLAGNPSFRALTGADITGAALSDVDDANVTLTLSGAPGTALLNATTITAGWNGVLSTARGGTGLSTIGTAGQVLAVNGGATGLEYVTLNNGTVTNFSAGDLAPLFTTSEATTTTTPALSFNLNTQAANTVFAGPAGGGPAAPTFRALTGSDIAGSALTTTDDANVTLTLGGTPATALLNAASITAGWTGQLSIARGGTGASTAPAALNNLLPSQAGNAGEFLTTDGSGNVSWSPVTASGAWNTTGNAGTTAGTNFIGTTDAVDFVVKTAGTERMRVDATGQVGFGRSTPEATNDLDGGLIWRPDTVYLLAGATHGGGANIRHDNVSIGDRAYIYIKDTASHYGNRITGFTDGVNGKMLRIFNSANTTLTLLVDDANSTVGNRIRNSIGDNGNVGISDSGFVDLVYDGETQHWIIHSVAGPTSTAASGFTYFARKTADQTLTSASHGTTLQNATGMTINIFPDIVHTCDGMFYFSSANSNVDVQIAFELTGGTADLSKITLLAHSDGGANVVDGSDIVQTNGVASATLNVSGGTEMFVQVSGMFINGASNATLQVKISRAGGSQDLVMKQGSYLRLIPVGVD